MWEQANSWRDPAGRAGPQSTFDRAAGRIDDELRDRVGLDPTQLQTLAAVQELETDHQEAAEPRARPAASTPGFDSADRGRVHADSRCHRSGGRRVRFR